MKGIYVAPWLLLAALVAGVVFLNPIAAAGLYALAWLLIRRFP